MSDRPRTMGATVADYGPVLAAICAVAVVIGSVGPWATVWIVTVNGTEGDGQITLVLGANAAILAGIELSRPRNARWLYAAMLVIFLLVAGIGINAWSNITSTASEAEVEGFAASVAWGLPVMVVAAGAGAVIAFIKIREIGRAQHDDRILSMPSSGPLGGDRDN